MQERILKIAHRVREALENATSWGGTYPQGCCQGDSRVLAKYLVEVEGIGPIEGIANGERALPSDDPDEPIRQSHFWLEYAGWIIDITADQYKDGPAPVMVTPDRQWHDQFRGQTRLPQSVVLDINDYLKEKYQRLKWYFEEGPASWKYPVDMAEIEQTMNDLKGRRETSD
jgi:hypothetical protein